MKIRAALVYLTGILLLVVGNGCSVWNETEKSTLMGLAAGNAGSAIGTMIGKRAGNPVVGATIGAALGSSTGAFIGRRLDHLSGPDKNKINTPLYVINGVPYTGKAAQHQLRRLSSTPIDQIVVLKQEEAIALYGDKGQHGAIIISVPKI